MRHQIGSRALDLSVLFILGALFLSLTGGGTFLILHATNVLQ